MLFPALNLNPNIDNPEQIKTFHNGIFIVFSKAKGTDLKISLAFIF